METATNYDCECGLSYSSTKILDNHKLNKLHQLRLKYNADKENKVTCTNCNIKIQIHAYEEHLKTIKHLENTNANTVKIKCVICSKKYREQNYEQHLNSSAHQNKIYAKENKKMKKEEHYEQMNDKANCCAKCKHVGIKRNYYNSEHNMCNYCYEVSIGYSRTCSYCDEVKPSEMFERPRMLYCKQCIKLRKNS